MNKFSVIVASILAIGLVVGAFILGNAYKYKFKSTESINVTGNALKDFNADKELINFLEKVPLNIGRHIISKYAIENNLNGFYLETFLGHYVSGAEQFGTFSNLNFKEYIKTMREFLSQIAEIYGIY